jgi:hypothetical protein
VLPFLFSVPDDDRGWDTFKLQHFEDHQEILTKIQKKFNVQLVVRPLYPIDYQDQKAAENWLDLHQQTHNDANAVLGTVGQDLGSVDFSKPREVQAWLFLNAQEHQNMRQALGI